MIRPAESRASGRPKAADAALLGQRIVDAAAELFLRDGYAATSVEAIANAAGVSKRTFYARFPDKAAVFLAVVSRLIDEWLQGFDEAVDIAHGIEEALIAVARKMIGVALTPAALSLHVLITAESVRFPEISHALHRSGAETGIARVAALLRSTNPALTPETAAMAARQFQGMVIHIPQAAAIAGAPAMDDGALDRWCRSAVAILLHGVSAA